MLGIYIQKEKIKQQGFCIKCASVRMMANAAKEYVKFA